MEILIACEESQVVCKAFRRRGHGAYSCDIVPCSGGHPEWHLQGDVKEWIDGCYDMPNSYLGSGRYHEWDMIIAFPPCTDLAASGAKWFEQKRKDGRQRQSIRFFMLFVNADCPRIAIENPIGIMSTVYRKPDQIIQPYMFGHYESKATCLWLKRLPPLSATKLVYPEEYACKCGHRFESSLGKYGCPNCCGENGAAKLVFRNQTKSGQNKLPPSEHRAMDRSRTYQGIADAMAAQWGIL